MTRRTGSYIPAARDLPHYQGFTDYQKSTNRTRRYARLCLPSDHPLTRYVTARYVGDLLTPLVGRSHRHVVNSKELSEVLRQTTVPNDHELVSFDVSALFTSIPLDIVISQTRTLLENDQTLPERTSLSTVDIVEMLEFVLKTTYFQFRGGFYQQLSVLPWVLLWRPL